MLRWVAIGCGLVTAGVGFGQTASTPAAVAPQLSPGAAYRAAMLPVEVTHRSIANWSETEQASLGVAIKQAGEACAARQPRDYTGSALIDMARLCSLGLAWAAEVEATSRYIAETADEKPLLTEAYAGLVDAELHLKEEAAAKTDALKMLQAVPYGPLTGEMTEEAIAYMELLYTADAVALARARQPKILTALDEGSGTIALPELYRQGLRLAVLQQLCGEDAAETIEALESALPETLSVDDQIPISAARRRYGVLGHRLPALGLLTQHPVIPVPRLVTALLLFPDWCAQCVEMAHRLPSEVFQVEGSEAYAFGLLTQTVPPRKAGDTKSATAQNAFDPALAAEYLKATPTAAVSPELLTFFGAADVPLLIVVDRKGLVRYIGTLDEGAMQPGQTFDSAIALVGRRWPGEAAGARAIR